MLPFTREQFIAVFVDYNTGVWPAQVVAYALTLLIVAAPFDRRVGWRTKAAAAALAALWIWTGVVYHVGYLSAISPPAFVFGALFGAQGVLLLVVGAVGGRPADGEPSAPERRVGWALIGYAMIVYPLLGRLTGHGWTELPSFGITPCPLTIFSLGVLLLAPRPVPRLLLVVPFVWALIGGSAAVLLGIVQDWVLLTAAAVPIWLFVRDGRPSPRAPARAGA